MRQSIYVPTEQKFGVQYFTRMKSSQAFFKRPFSKGRARDVRLHDDVFDDLAFDVRKPEIPAGVAIGELLVIHAEQVQSGFQQDRVFRLHGGSPPGCSAAATCSTHLRPAAGDGVQRTRSAGLRRGSRLHCRRRSRTVALGWSSGTTATTPMIPEGSD